MNTERIKALKEARRQILQINIRTYEYKGDYWDEGFDAASVEVVAILDGMIRQEELQGEA